MTRPDDWNGWPAEILLTTIEIFIGAASFFAVTFIGWLVLAHLGWLPPTS